MAKKLKIRDLTLRDGQQSAFATRLNQAQVDRVLPFYKDANFYAMEVWGGAVPDSVMRYLNENPWTRLESIKAQISRAAVTCSATARIPMKSSTVSAVIRSQAASVSCVYSTP